MMTPVIAFHRCDTAAITAAPPPPASFSRDQSTSLLRGCATSPAYSVFTPMKTLGRAAFSVSMKASKSRGFGTSQLSAPRVKKVMKFTISANTWYSGIAVTMTWPGTVISGGMKALYCSTLATRLRCDSAAPFDSPVVPPVYCRNSRSPPFVATGAKGSAAPSANALARLVAPARRASTGGLGNALPLPSPTPWVMTVFSPVLAMTSATVPDTALKTTMISTPASFSWCCNSCGVYSGLTFTCAAPARTMPRKAIGKAKRFGVITAMRSPFFTPSLFCR